MGPGENMKMSVVLPGGLGVAFTGTKSKPGIDAAKTAQIILQQQLLNRLGGKTQQGTQQGQTQQGQGGLFGLPIPVPGGQQQQDGSTGTGTNQQQQIDQTLKGLQDIFKKKK
jgi:hypothetical protein